MISLKRVLVIAASTAMLLTASGCALFQPPPTPAAPAAGVTPSQQRIARALAYLTDGLNRYESGIFEEAKVNFLMAVDSGALTLPQLLNARKHMAFIYALQNREASAREEFEKAMALDPKFELTLAEAGHPIWGPVYRQVKIEDAQRRSGQTLLASVFPAKQPTPAERLFNEGILAYDAGDYAGAVKLFITAQKETAPVTTRIKAHKQAAFSYCLLQQNKLCRAEFEKILKLQPAFALEPAEAGHPSWGATFRLAQAASRAAQTAAPKAASKTTMKPPSKK